MAYTLNGSTQYLSVSDTSFLDVGTGDFSIFLRINKDASSRRFLISKRVDADNFYEFEWEAANTIFLRMRIAATVEIQMQSATALSTSTDYRLLWVIDRDSSANTEIYVNASIDTKSSGLIVSATDLDLSAATGLGRWQGDGFYFDGVISEFALWTGAVLSGAEATMLEKFSPLKVRPDALAIYAPLVRGLQDIVGGFTLVNNNSATVSAHPPVIRPSAQILQFPPAAAGAIALPGFHGANRGIMRGVNRGVG